MIGPDPADMDLQVPGGRIRARRHGDGGHPLVLGVPGLSANLVSLERIASAHPMVALDLRGRGFSDSTPAGTYGWDNHAADVLGAAGELGAVRFAIVGWSMGAHVALACARRAPGRLERVVLIDALGVADRAVVDLIRMSVDRLGTVYPSVDHYLALVRSTGLIEPWDAMWERYFAYELAPVEGGVVARTSRAAVEEDIAYGMAVTDPEPYWAALDMPVLVVRAARPLIKGTDAHVVSPGLLARFRSVVAGAEVVEVDANHYGVGTHPDTVAAVRAFLGDG